MIKLKPAPDLKAILKEKGVALQDICDHFGLHRTTVTRYINGELMMSVSFLFSFADWAGINVYDLVEHAKNGDVVIAPLGIKSTNKSEIKNLRSRLVALEKKVATMREEINQINNLDGAKPK